MITEATFDDLRNAVNNGHEALVCLGCGGDLSEWEHGVRNWLIQEHIARPDFDWEQVLQVKTTGGRCDLALFFNRDRVDMGRLVIWRIKFGDCSWLSDYVVNYADQHQLDWLGRASDHDYYLDEGMDDDA